MVAKGLMLAKVHELYFRFGLDMVLYQTKTLLFQGQHGTKLKETLIELCVNSTSIESTRRKEVLQDNNTEIISTGKNTASALTTDAESCNCPCVAGILIELENIKLNMDIVESRTAALQSLANEQKVSFTSNECSSEINRLSQELFEERHKTSQLQSDLARIDFNRLPLIEMPVAPFRLRCREEHRLTKNQDWLNYLDFVRKKTRNSTPKQH